tara:strand:- start:670 stop:894 length:225 start_codon:yes stop_codon:yes gene_type:complete
MIENLKFKFNYYIMELEMWWSEFWMGEDEKKEIKNSIKKRRGQGGCSSWKQFLKENPEHAKHDWEKEFINNQKD